MSSNYYYLISSLPELRLDDYKEPYQVNELIEELYLNLDPKRCRYVRDVLYMNDNPNIIDVLCGAGNTWIDARGNYTFKQMEQMLLSPDSIDGEKDGYIVSFYNEFRMLSSRDEKPKRDELENLLLKGFYKKMMDHENDFIKNYFTFDYYLRNTLLALNKRKFQDQDIELLDIDQDDIIKKLNGSSSGDFGLGGNLDFMSRILDIFEKDDIVQREKAIDQMRWEMIDQINTFAYFKVDTLLGYLIKLMMVERWIAMTDQKGGEVFDRLSEVDEKILEGFLK